MDGNEEQLGRARGFKAHGFGVAYNRHDQISFATPLCSFAFPNQVANSLITGFVSVNPITSYLLCADTPLNKQTAGVIVHYHSTDLSPVCGYGYVDMDNQLNQGLLQKEQIKANEKLKPRDCNSRAHSGMFWSIGA